MKKADKIQLILNELDRLYPKAECALHYTKPYELLIATRLSAQCTDERVNKVTPALFKRYPTLEAFAEADFDELCEMVHSCGFFRGKAKSIIEMSQAILERFDGKVPDNIDDLISLSGIGRKTANLICGDIYGKPAIIADTHCIRLSNRLGLATSTNPEIVERQLKAAIPAERQTKFCHNLVHHGRAICDARKPNCCECPLTEVCTYYKKAKKN